MKEPKVTNQNLHGKLVQQILLVLDSIAQLWSNYCCDPILVAHGTAISDKREVRGGAILLPSKPEFFCNQGQVATIIAP